MSFLFNSFIFASFRIISKQACFDLLNELSKIVSSHLGATQRQKDVALETLSKMKDALSTNELYYRDFIMQITSLEPMVLSSSLAGLKLVDDEDKNHERALGDLFHSEPLYTIWKTANPDSVPYFFTQRDMCAVCDPHVCQYFKDKDSVPFFIISAREGNTPGQKSVDQVFSLSDGKWESIGAPLDGRKIHYGEQDTKVQRFLLPDLYSNKVVLQTQRDKLLAKLEFVITNFNDTPKTLRSLNGIIIEGKNLDIPREQLKGVIASLEMKNHEVWTKLLTIIEQ